MGANRAQWGGHDDAWLMPGYVRGHFRTRRHTLGP